MKFEKWQALGNDYLIVEAAALPWELTPERIRRICDPHFGAGSDGILLLAPVEDPDHVAELRIFNPDGSEAELSGNGAREAVMYLRRSGWTDADEFTILTKAGPITPTIRTERECTLEMGSASTSSPDFPSGGRTAAENSRPVAGPALSARLDRQPAVRDRGGGRARVARSAGDRPGDRGQRSLPEPDQRELLPRRRRPRPCPDLRTGGGGDPLLGNRRLRRGGGGPPGGRAGVADGGARRRRAAGRDREGPVRTPHRLGRAGLRGGAVAGVRAFARGAA